MDTTTTHSLLAGIHWQVWFVSAVLIAAAVIDGIQLRVPNWITFPFILTGWIYSGTTMGWDGFQWSLWGTLVGLGLLLPAYCIGGMGAGDVKLLAGVGAWMHATNTFYAFAFSAIIGAVLAIAMVLYRQAFRKHASQFWAILQEMAAIKDPTQLAELAAQRKSSMLLLPYGIPIAIGSIMYFYFVGLFVV